MAWKWVCKALVNGDGDVGSYALLRMTICRRQSPRTTFPEALVDEDRSAESLASLRMTICQSLGIAIPRAIRSCATGEKV